MRFNLLLLYAFFLFSFKRSSENIQQLSLNFSSKILEKGKYINIEGEVYFKKKNGVLTTRLIKPFENITIVNGSGEMKIYDPLGNTIIQNHSALNSSETSYLWHFLNGAHNDMGYGKSGYVIKNSKIDKGYMITVWVPKPGYSTPISSIELVHENTLPIFVSFKDNKNKFLGKIFFSSYKKIGDINLPLRIVEISYREKSDSVITTKSYSNPKINSAVDPKYLDFKIPTNARIIETE